MDRDEVNGCIRGRAYTQVGPIAPGSRASASASGTPKLITLCRRVLRTQPRRFATWLATAGPSPTRQAALVAVVLVRSRILSPGRRFAFRDRFKGSLARCCEGKPTINADRP